MFDGIFDQLEEDTSAWSNADRVEFLRGLERSVRHLQSLGHTVINQLVEQGAASEFGGVKELGATTLIIGEVLPPRLRKAARTVAAPLSVRMLAHLDPGGWLEDERDRRRKSFVRLGVLPHSQSSWGTTPPSPCANSTRPQDSRTPPDKPPCRSGI